MRIERGTQPSLPSVLSDPSLSQSPRRTSTQSERKKKKTGKIAARRGKQAAPRPCCRLPSLPDCERGADAQMMGACVCVCMCLSRSHAIPMRACACACRRRASGCADSGEERRGRRGGHRHRGTGEDAQGRGEERAGRHSAAEGGRRVGWVRVACGVCVCCARSLSCCRCVRECVSQELAGGQVTDGAQTARRDETNDAPQRINAHNVHTHTTVEPQPRTDGQQVGKASFNLL
jgi:hypothetical protein